MPKFVVFNHTFGHRQKRATLRRRTPDKADTIAIVSSLEIVEHACETAFLRSLAAIPQRPFAYIVFTDDVPDEKAIAIACDDPPLPLTLLADESTRSAKDLRVVAAGQAFLANGSDIVYRVDELKTPINYNSQTTPRRIEHGNLTNPLSMKYIEGMYRLAGRRLPWVPTATERRAAPAPSFVPFTQSTARAALISIMGTPSRIGNANLAARETSS